METGAGDGADWFACPSETQWGFGEVGVIGLLPIQRYQRSVLAVDEDVGATLDEGHGRAWHNLYSHSVVTVHHAANDLNLQRNDSRECQPAAERGISNPKEGPPILSFSLINVVQLFILCFKCPTLFPFPDFCISFQTPVLNN